MILADHMFCQPTVSNQSKSVTTGQCPNVDRHAYLRQDSSTRHRCRGAKVTVQGQGEGKRLHAIAISACYGACLADSLLQLSHSWFANEARSLTMRCDHNACKTPDQAGSETNIVYTAPVLHESSVNAHSIGISCASMLRLAEQGARKLLEVTSTTGTVRYWMCCLLFAVPHGQTRSRSSLANVLTSCGLMCRSTDTFVIAGARGFANNKTSTGPHGGSGV